MKIVFVSVVLNNHQVGVSDRLFELTGGEFRFIETGGNSVQDKKGGGDYSSRPYLMKVTDENNRAAAFAEIDSADVMVYGAAPIEYLRHRVKSGKLTFLYTERWLKKGLINLLSPRLLKQQLFYHLHCHGKPLYALCASAYAASDFRKMLSFRGRCFKWGYFPKIDKGNIDEIIAANENDPVIRILWVGRFIDWKHPETMIGLARSLQSSGADYKITMIGDGPELEKINQDAINSDLNIEFMGVIPNLEVQKQMRCHHIFCFTSDRQEGWGAVLNEAMGNGCCPIAAVEAGATGFLIRNGINGYSGSIKYIEDLYSTVISLIEDRKRLKDLRLNAYRTIHNAWNSETAANNLYQLSFNILKGDSLNIMEGPCSNAL